MTQRPRAARLILLLLLVFSAFFAAACGDSPEARTQKALGRGEGYLKERKLNEAAREMFVKAASVGAGYAPARMALGRLSVPG